jgi:hypothetical protein
MAHLRHRVRSDNCVTTIESSDVERFLMRKAFCAAQKVLSQFIRDFSHKGEVVNWFEEFLSTVSDQHNRRTVMISEGDGCTWDMYVQFSFMTLHLIYPF